MCDYEGHGSHWKCLVEDLDKAEDEWLRPTLTNGRVIDKWSSGPLAMREAVGIAWPDTPLRILSIVVGETGQDGQPGNVFASAFPWAAHGTRHCLVIDNVQSWSNGLEGWITASFPEGDGPSLTFFDTRFYANKDRYAVGKEMDFILGAVAYQATVVHPEPVFIEKIETIRAMRAGSEREGDDSPIEVQMAGAAILFPRDDLSPGDHEFQGPVREVQTFDLSGRQITRLSVTLSRIHERESEDVNVTIYVEEGHWGSNERPLPGADVQGMLWLQGYLSELE
ncbi:conserved protein of unknown function [Magnetospirillum sp. XM-1]|uniref:hypothetical protein n=1 Tax=Magnetospirillum sp. XM-1 TaxID=1663591 RepID=UPI00073DDFD3|nr:hypothetical protein [Magnetospirillum sp. XM-1]CUW37141.1 conserved protein of unknown function [Magnetospirillum sp. XM-1]